MDVFLLCLSCAGVAALAGYVAAAPLFDGGMLHRAGRWLAKVAARAESSALSRWLLSHRAWSGTAQVLGGRWGIPAPGGWLMVFALLSPLFGIICSRSLLGGAVLPLLFVAAIQLVSSKARRTDEEAIAEEIPEVFRTLAVSLESGSTLRQAIDYVGVSHHGKVGQSFAHATLRMQAGESVKEALAGIEREVKGPGMELMVSALEIAQRTGSPLKELFAESAGYVERQGELKRELSAKTAQVRLSVEVVCTLPAAIVALLSLISPDFRSGLATAAGMGSVLLAAVLDTFAILIIRRLAQGVI